MQHLLEQTVLDLVAGQLDERAAIAAHEHIDRCTRCLELVAVAARLEPPADDRGEEDAVSPTAATALTRAGSPRGQRRAGELPVDRVDEYQLTGLLGRGGMGAVYLAHDTLLDREVAIKLISLEVAPEHRRRLLVEARAAARIKHPNVVTVYRVGELDGQPYIAYERVRGKTLAELARPTPWPKVVELAVGIARGLAAAHEVGVLHRDIKPGNLMLSEAGEVVLLDFGLAKIAGEEAAAPLAAAAAPPASPPPPAPAAPDGSRVTATGMRMGTPRYMSPEAWRGEPATAQSDIYSLGVVLYELAAGRAPFGAAASDELARRVLGDDPPPLAGAAPWVPPALAAMVDRCIRRDPGERFASAVVLRGELEAVQTRRALEAVDRLRARGEPPAGNPYRGTAPFGPGDQALFFGRRAELEALIDRVQRTPFVLVAGDPGVGKTSLCAAGLLPLVGEGALGGPRHWACESVVCGERPLAALAAVLARHLGVPPNAVEELARDRPDELAERLRRGHGLCSGHLLFVDQLEALVTRCDPDEARRTARLLGLLAEPSATVRLVAAVHADALTRIAALPGLDAAVGPAVYLLVPPRGDALREIVTGPAELAGRAIDPPLVDRLVDRAQRGELSLAGLQEQLADHWQRAAPTS
jgi:serine/threonine protein kinase